MLRLHLEYHSKLLIGFQLTLKFMFPIMKTAAVGSDTNEENQKEGECDFMLKTLAAQVKEFKRDSILTPVFMILEVLFEMLIPLLMASIIDKGVETGDIRHGVDGSGY